MTSDEDDYNLPDVHNNIQKYYNKMLLTRDDIVKNIITILNEIIYSEFYTNEDNIENKIKNNVDLFNRSYVPIKYISLLNEYNFKSSIPL